MITPMIWLVVVNTTHDYNTIYHTIWSKCTSLTIGLTYYRKILYIYIYIYHLYLFIITWHLSLWFNATCQCVIDHRMLSPLGLHPHFIQPCMFMTNNSMTRVIRKIATHVKLVAWVRVKVRVHEGVCHHEHFLFCHVANNHLFVKISLGSG